MTETAPISSQNPSPSAPAKKQKGCLVQVLIFLGILLLVVLATVGLTVWWVTHKHDIKAVDLTPPEEVMLEEKVIMLSGEKPEKTLGDLERPDLPEGAIEFTEREINGVVSDNEGLRERVYIDLHPGRIEVKMNYEMPDEAEFFPGKTLRANIFLKVELQAEHLELRIQKFTISGFSVPSAWMGDLKNVDLMDEFLGGSDFAKAFARGLKTLEVGEDYIRVVPNE